MNTSPTIGVGIVGLSASGSWASWAHLPALTAVEGFELRAVANSSAASAQAAADAYGVPVACGSVEELAARDDIDLVVVSVKAPRHRELVLPALAAGTPVLCEWPLANGVAEAAEMTKAAADVRSFVGLQGRSAPGVRYLHDLVADGFVGEVLSTSLIASGGAWGTPVNDRSEYLLDRSNGATLLTIVFGHLVDSFAEILGEPADVSVTTATRRLTILNVDSGRQVPMTAEDQIAVTGTLTSGTVASVHLRGGTSRTTNLLWEINGTEGDLQITGSGGSISGALTIRGARGDDGVVELPVPDRYDDHPDLAGQPAHAVAHAYDRIRRDLTEGEHDAPDFADGLRRHQLLDHVEGAAADGTRHRVS